MCVLHMSARLANIYIYLLRYALEHVDMPNTGNLHEDCVAASLDLQAYDKLDRTLQNTGHPRLNVQYKRYRNGKVSVYVIIYLKNLYTRKRIASLCSNYQRDIKRVEPFCVPRIKRSCGVEKYCTSVREMSTIYKYVIIHLHTIYILGVKAKPPIQQSTGTSIGNIRSLPKL